MNGLIQKYFHEGVKDGLGPIWAHSRGPNLIARLSHLDPPRQKWIFSWFQDPGPTNQTFFRILESSRGFRLLKSASRLSFILKTSHTDLMASWIFYNFSSCLKLLQDKFGFWKLPSVIFWLEDQTQSWRTFQQLEATEILKNLEKLDGRILKLSGRSENLSRTNRIWSTSLQLEPGKNSKNL